MRDQIAALVKEIRYKPNYSNKQSWQFAAQILTLIRKEIEKVENPTKGVKGIPSENSTLFNDGFRVAKRKILALFKEDK